MNKHELTQRLARESHRSRGQAADAVDALVHKLLKDLSSNSAQNAPGAAELPGFVSARPRAGRFALKRTAEKQLPKGKRKP